MSERIIPQLPDLDRQMRIIIDTDIASEIDDTYACTLAFACPQRFKIEGMIATHFAQKAGPESIEKSYDAICNLTQLAGVSGQFPIVKGGDPMQYLHLPTPSDGADLIIERAHAGSEQNPLWVIGIGAATNLASAVYKDPSISPKVRFVFHARCEEHWPTHTTQYNVVGDSCAARSLLDSDVPLVWFDTGEPLRCPMEVTEQKLLPLGGLGKFLHEYRYRSSYFQRADKGFFDIADFAWMLNPQLCQNDIVDAPTMMWDMKFHDLKKNGQMLRVHHIEPEPAWELYFDRVCSFIKQLP